MEFSSLVITSGDDDEQAAIKKKLTIGFFYHKG